MDKVKIVFSTKDDPMQIRPIRTTLSIIAILHCVNPLSLSAQGNDIDVHGFFLGNFAGRVTGLTPDEGIGGDYILAEERLRIDIDAWSGAIDASAKFKIDFLHDALADDFDVDIRESYIDYATGGFDFRLGRQITTWGVGDLLFINDVFPKDWSSFFSGRPLEYLKSGVDGIRTRYSSSSLSIDLIVIPFFDPDILPMAERFFMFDPLASIETREESLPESDYGNTELALRLYRRVIGFDTAVYTYRGYWRTPGMMLDDLQDPTMVTLFYPELSVVGASSQGSGLGGLLSFEVGYYDSRDDPRGDDPLVPNSQIRLLAGYQRPFGDDFSLGAQYYTEIMADHRAYLNSLPPGFHAQEKYRDTVTLRLEQFLKYHTWKLTFFSFYSPNDEDFLLQPQVTHKFSDELSMTLGGNILGGKEETTFLGQFDKNDNAYLSARFDF